MKESLYLKHLTEEDIGSRLSEFLALENAWTEIGEPLWNLEKFLKPLPKKFDGLSFIALNEDKIVGYLIGSQISKEKVKLNKILTKKDFQGNGVGSKLWSEFIKVCRNGDYNALEFRVLENNTSAINFYLNKGCLLNGQTLGADGKIRIDCLYVFNGQIPHSKPTLDNSEEESVLSVLRSGYISSGKKSKELAELIKKEMNKDYALTVSSGTNALFLALKALGIKSNDEVIIPSYTCESILNSVENTGAKARIVDINDDYSLDPYQVKNNLSKDTKAIIVVNPFGKIANSLEKISKYEIPVIEDCAQTLGATNSLGFKAGEQGYISITSLAATKLITAGSGGVVLTNDSEIYDRLCGLINHDKKENWMEAYNFSMNDIQATIGIAQCKKLANFIKSRKEIAIHYKKILNETEFKTPDIEDRNIFYRFIVQHELANQIINSMKKRGIYVEKPISKPLHRFKHLEDALFPNTIQKYESSISLSIYPSLTEDKANIVAGALLNWRFEK